MAYAIVAFDAEDKDAMSRRMAVRDRHLGVIEGWARDGRLALAVPLFPEAGGPTGSLIVLDVPSQEGVDDYLSKEPFAAGDVWKQRTVFPMRIAPLPYQPLVPEGATLPTKRTHTVIVALDGKDPGALDRRMKVREAHFARVRSMAADGTLAFGGAVLDDSGRMIGSIAVVRFDTDAAARDWMNADPYVTGDVWQDITLYGTRFAPLPYRPLPGATDA